MDTPQKEDAARQYEHAMEVAIMSGKLDQFLAQNQPPAAPAPVAPIAAPVAAPAPQLQAPAPTAEPAELPRPGDKRLPARNLRPADAMDNQVIDLARSLQHEQGLSVRDSMAAALQQLQVIHAPVAAAQAPAPQDQQPAPVAAAPAPTSATPPTLSAEELAVVDLRTRIDEAKMNFESTDAIRQLNVELVAAERSLANLRITQAQQAAAAAQTNTAYESTYDATIDTMRTTHGDLFVEGSALNEAYQWQLQRAEAAQDPILNDPAAAARELVARAARISGYQPVGASPSPSPVSITQPSSLPVSHPRLIAGGTPPPAAPASASTEAAALAELDMQFKRATRSSSVKAVA